MYRWISSALVVLCLATGALVGQPAEVPQQACCGVKPVYTDPAYAAFTGQVAVVTYEQIFPATDVLRVVDLNGANIAPLNMNWITSAYINPTWTVTRLGALFGVVLDDSGNIYATATTVYGTKGVGTGGTHGTVYKIANGTGTVTNLATLPSSAVNTVNAAGLGNIAFDCDTHTLFVSDFDNGLIYQLNPNTGAIMASWNHGMHLTPIIPDDPTKTYTPLGRRVWAVRTSNRRLYYSGVWENPGEINPTRANEIWSVALNAVSGFVPGSQRLEITMPPFPSITNDWSNPVAGINFGPGGNILLSERSMFTSGGVIYTGAHQSRVVEYAPGVSWTATTNTFGISVMTPPTSSAGSSDYDFTPGVTPAVWAMADALQFTPAVVYGLQGLPSTGGGVANSVLIDVSGTTTQADKTMLGSVDIPCPSCPPVQLTIGGLETACQSPSVYCATGPPGSSFTWTVTGGTFTPQSANCIIVSWNATGPHTLGVTATQPNGCRTTARRNIAACPTLCCETPMKATLQSIKRLSNGNYNVTAALTAPIGNIKRIRTTIVSTHQQFSSASCGTSGPVGSTIASAPTQNGFLSFLPPFSRQVTWTHPTTGAPVNNTSFSFELALPPPPTGDCADQIDFCVRWEFTSTDCRTCEITTCWKINRGQLMANPTPIDKTN